MRTVGVYGIRNTITGKYYVGGSVDIKRRWATHRKELTLGTHTGVKLLRAWQKYGPNTWEWVVLEECQPDKRLLLEREQHWIDTLLSYEDGYNSLPKVGQGTRGRKQTPEEIAKRVATRLAHGSYYHTEETKKLIGDIQRGKKRGPMSEAQKQKISEAHLNNPMSESERKRISKMAKERVYTDEIRANISKAHLGYVMLPLIWGNQNPWRRWPRRSSPAKIGAGIFYRPCVGNMGCQWFPAFARFVRPRLSRKVDGRRFAARNAPRKP